MDRYIGLDTHASSCTLGVMTPSGKRIGSHVVQTNARCLIEAIRQIPPPRHICLEEGTLAERLYEQMDALEALKRDAKKAMIAEAKRHPELRLVKSCPGLGSVRTAELLPIVVTP